MDISVIAVKAAQLVTSLSILVVLHELGHFIPAKIFKCRVEKFYLFFDAYFSVFKKTIGGTEYGIGWLPLGGYVKISGMIDESMDTEQMNKEPQPWEFRSKPAWQRLIIMAGGVIVNIILAIVIYAMMSYTWGEVIVAPKDLKYGIAVNNIGEKLGLKSSDKILKIDGETIKDFNNVKFALILGETATIERQGEIKQITLHKKEVIEAISDDSLKLIIEPRVPAKVANVTPNSLAQKAGMTKGDKLIALNGQKLNFSDQYMMLIPTLKGQKTVIRVERKGKIIDLNATIGNNGKLGFNLASIAEFKDELGIKRTEYTFLQSIPRGFVRAKETLDNYLKQFRILFNSELRPLAKGFGSFLSMGNLFPSVWDWYSFWSITAFLSVMLAVLNILPIPALDGGHIVFVLYEMITGKKPSQKVLENAQIIGFFIMMGIMLLAVGNDLRKFFF